MRLSFLSFTFEMRYGVVGTVPDGLTDLRADLVAVHTGPVDRLATDIRVRFRNGRSFDLQSYADVRTALLGPNADRDDTLFGWSLEAVTLFACGISTIVRVRGRLRRDASTSAIPRPTSGRQGRRSGARSGDWLRRIGVENGTSRYRAVCIHSRALWIPRRLRCRLPVVSIFSAN
jgi:hypothetical protein